MLHRVLLMFEHLTAFQLLCALVMLGLSVGALVAALVIDYYTTIAVTTRMPKGTVGKAYKFKKGNV